MEYKNYVGSIDFSKEDGIFYGKVIGIRALVSYEGATVHELVNDFRTAIDDYLALCAENGIEPESGGMKMNDKNKIVEEYLKRTNPYEQPKPINYDVRAYAAYVEEHGLSANEITPKILQMFTKDKETGK